MYNTHINRSENTNNFGVIIDNKLNWSVHINKIAHKANRMMGLIKHSVGYNALSVVTKQSYISLVESILKYCLSDMRLLMI